jgi:hypothetical protein
VHRVQTGGLITVRKLLIVVAVLLSASPVRAQFAQAEPAPPGARVRVGPLYLNPSIALTNLGVDTNVFNESAEENPKRDFMLAVEPKTDVWLRMGPTWVSGLVGEQVTWYQKYTTERSSNNRYRLGWSVPLNRLAFKINGSYVSTRERPGFEIDTRAQRHDKGFDSTLEVRALAKTHFGITVGMNKTAFADDQFFLQRNLQTELNREGTSLKVSVRNQLTPLTSLTFDAGRSRERFEFSPRRDSDSDAVTARVQFEPLALISGSASIGYRKLDSLAADVPDFSGLTTAVDLTYVILGSTRFGVEATRDVTHSFDADQPYYLHTGFTASIAQQLFGPLDVVGRYGAQRLSYRDRTDAVVEAPHRVDHVKSYGGGVGYHLGRDLRIGVNLDRSDRESPLTNRRYEGLKFGTSITYGL